jgi:hypothetical protein
MSMCRTGGEIELAMDNLSLRLIIYWEPGNSGLDDIFMRFTPHTVTLSLFSK